MDTRNDLTVVTDLTPHDFDANLDDRAGSHLHMFYNAETNTVALCDEYEGFGVISKYVGWKHVLGEVLYMKRISHRYVYVGRHDEHYVVFDVTDTIVEKKQNCRDARSTLQCNGVCY